MPGEFFSRAGGVMTGEFVEPELASCKECGLPLIYKSKQVKELQEIVERLDEAIRLDEGQIYNCDSLLVIRGKKELR